VKEYQIDLVPIVPGIVVHRSSFVSGAIWVLLVDSSHSFMTQTAQQLSCRIFPFSVFSSLRYITGDYVKGSDFAWRHHQENPKAVSIDDICADHGKSS